MVWIQIGNGGIDSKFIVSITHTKIIDHYSVEVTTNIKTFFGYKTLYFHVPLDQRSTLTELHNNLKTAFIN